MVTTNHNHLEGLDADQITAVLAPTSIPVLVLAGAGSGKTTVLVRRIAHLINQGINPNRIIATTFTRDAAREIRERVKGFVGNKANGVEIRTIHSLCLMLLRNHLETVNILDFGPQRRTVGNAVDEAYKAMRIPRGDRRRIGWRYWMQWIEWAKREGKGKAEDFYAQMAESRPDFEYNRLFAEIAAMVLESYEESKGDHFDLTDLLTQTHRLMVDGEDILSQIQGAYDYVLIDEAQDTSTTQLDILRMIARDRHFSLIGDADQSLYHWRGADPQDNIFTFKERYPDGAIIHLGTNYRSTRAIVKAAKSLIHNNYLDESKKPYEKNLRPREGAEDGSEVVTVWAMDSLNEATWIRGVVKGLIQTHYQPKDIYILARTRAALAHAERELTTAGIPAVSLGGSYWESARVGDVLGILTLAHNPDDDNAFLTAYDIPSPSWELTTRRLGARFIEELQKLGKGSLWQGMLASYDQQKPFRKKAIDDALGYYSTLQEKVKDRALVEVVGDVLQHYRDYWIAKEGLDAEEDLEILEPLPSIISSLGGRWEDLTNHIQRVKQATKDRNQAEAVVLSTIHGVKGLERPIVIGVGISDGICPHWLSTGDLIATTNNPEGMSRDEMPPSPYDGNLEDERCAMYVLMTRARERLCLSAVENQGVKVNLEPSRFLLESGLQLEVEA